MITIEDIKVKYPGANASQIGDSPKLASELADLIKKGLKTASCGSFASYQQEVSAPKIGSYSIILDGQNVPVCVIRLVSMRLVRFCDVTEEFARKEGEGDLSLECYQRLVFLLYFSLSVLNMPYWMPLVVISTQRRISPGSVPVQIKPAILSVEAITLAPYVHWSVRGNKGV